MRLLTACIVATALTAATAKKKKRRRKVDARTEQQRLCDACMGLAEYARTAVNVAIKKDAIKVDWPAVLEEGCPAPECGTLLKGVSTAIAEELHMLVEDGDTIDARVLPDLLCAPASVTGACRDYDPPDATPRTKLVVALHNERKIDAKTQGRIEVHLVAPGDMDKDCAPSEDIRNRDEASIIEERAHAASRRGAAVRPVDPRPEPDAAHAARQAARRALRRRRGPERRPVGGSVGRVLGAGPAAIKGEAARRHFSAARARAY